MTDSEANDLAEVLASAAAAVAAVSNGLEARLSLGVMAELERHADRIVQCTPVPTTAVPTNVRHAAVALAQEIQAANTALKARVLAAGQHPGVEEEELPTVAALLQSLVVGLLDLFTLEAHGDADLALRITAAGVVSVDGGSLALSMWPKSVAGSTKHHICLMRVVINLEHMAILDEGHKQSLEVLRATTFRPEAILTALRRLLPGQDPPGVVSDREDRSLFFLYTILHEQSFFNAEQAAIEGDMQLQAGIVANLHESIRRFVSLSGTGSADTASYLNACNSIWLLRAAPLLVASRERAARDPTGLIRMLSACLDLILERPPEGGQDAENLHILGVSYWSRVVLSSYGHDDRVGPPLITMPVADFLDCIKRAAAAAAYMIQQPGGYKTNLDDALAGLYQLIAVIPEHYRDWGEARAAAAEAAGSTDAERDALFLSLITTLEGIIRVTALLPESWRLRYFIPEERLEPYLGCYTILTNIMRPCLSLCWPEGQPPPGGMVSQATMMAAAGMVDSLGKLALITAGRATGTPRSVALDPARFDQVVLGELEDLGTEMIRSMAPAVPTAQGARDVGTMKRGQGTALAACSTVVALTGKGMMRSVSNFKMLPIRLQPWPGVALLLLEVPAGRSAMREAVMRTLELGEEGSNSAGYEPACSVLARYARFNVASALMFARCGAFTQLASWGELQCGNSPSAGCKKVLRLVQNLLERAVHGSGAAEVQEAYRCSGNSPADASSAAYWRRLRVEVIAPLADALEAKAAAMYNPTDVAVFVAEALATRNCAHVGCTTVVGFSEAAAPPGKRCSGCRLVRYCGVACQKADWPAHKAACRELRRRSAGGS